MDFLSVLNQKISECDAALHPYLDKLGTDGGGSALYEAVRYGVTSGGKRLRMAAVTESARLFADDAADAVPFACAAEFIHAYSLIHDDLPAIDDADYRRGKPSCHRAFGECAAILAGDALLHYAFEIMAEAAVKAGPGRTEAFTRAMYEIASHSGINGMVYGQALDTTPGAKPDINMLKIICEKKTASMFIGPMKAGAIIAGADAGQIERVGRFALNFGIAFQIADDIADESGEVKATGKKGGADKKNGVTTYASLLGTGAARREMDRYMDEAKVAISSLDRRGFFIGLCDYISSRADHCSTE